MADLEYTEVEPWAGCRRWQCDLCDYDTLIEGTFEAHFAKYHDLRCTEPGCVFKTRDVYELRAHVDIEHLETSIVLTDIYGHPVD